MMRIVTEIQVSARLYAWRQAKYKQNNIYLDHNIKIICNIPLNCNLEKKWKRLEKGRETEEKNRKVECERGPEW